MLGLRMWFTFSSSSVSGNQVMNMATGVYDAPLVSGATVIQWASAVYADQLVHHGEQRHDLTFASRFLLSNNLGGCSREYLTSGNGEYQNNEWIAFHCGSSSLSAATYTPSSIVCLA
jgi:hypothetical protein